jgi:hypothetical protein
MFLLSAFIAPAYENTGGIFLNKKNITFAGRMMPV